MQILPLRLPDTGYIRDSVFRQLLSVSPATLWRWTRAGLVPQAHKLGPQAVGRRVEDVREFFADPEAWRAAHAKAVA